MSVNVAQTLINLLGSVTVAGVLTVGLQGFFGRKKTSAEAEKAEAEAADVLTGKALTMVSKLEEQVTRAQDRVNQLDQETNQLRTDLRATSADLRTANDQVDELSRKLGSLIAAILAPDATLERLRAMVGHGPGINGTNRSP